MLVSPRSPQKNTRKMHVVLGADIKVLTIDLGSFLCAQCNVYSFDVAGYYILRHVIERTLCNSFLFRITVRMYYENNVKMVNK